MAYFAFNPRGQSHPFWDFVASVDNDYGDTRRPPSYAPRDRAQGQEAHEEGSANKQQAQENEKYKTPSVEDEKMADAEAGGPSKRDLADTEKPTDKKDKENPSGDEGWGRRCRRGGPRGMHRHGPPPFGPFGFPPFGPGFGADFSDWAPPHHHGHRGGPRRHHHHGPPPPPGAGNIPPPPEFGPHGHHGRRHHRGGLFGRRGPGREFNIPRFLSQLGQRLGVDLNAAAASFGIDLSRVTDTSDSDFVPFHDLFDLSDEYLIHVSLPGAHKEDIGLDFDAENHVLRVGGVVYRPGIDETISSALVYAGRNREVGVFESKIRLPSIETNDIEVNVSGISAKLREGILVIHVPKIQRKKEDSKRSIRIDTPSPSPERDLTNPPALPIHDKPRYGQSISRQPPATTDNKGKDKAPTPIADLNMYHSSPTHASAAAATPGTEKGDEAYDTEKNEKEKAHEDETMRDDPPEQLPAYVPTAAHPHDEDYGTYDDDNSSQDEEGEYVKINVD